MDLSDLQKRQLITQRRGIAGCGGVLVLGGALAVFYAVPTSFGYWLGWGLMGAGAFALLMAGAMCAFPRYMLRETESAEERDEKRPAA